MKENTLRRLKLSPLNKCRIYHWLRYNAYKQNVDRAISTYFHDTALGPDERQALKKEMRIAFVRYHWDFSEFFLYKYYELTDSQRASYVSEYDKNVFCEKVNDPGQAHILSDKWATYQKYKRFFKREAVLLIEIDKLKSESIQDFISSHRAFIIKPTNSSLGRGIKIVRYQSVEEAAALLHKYCRPRVSYILEELIQQSEEMASFHKESVNTLRIRSFVGKNGIEVFYPLIRMGTGEDFVDNAGHGGIFAIVDMQTGRTVYAGDKKNNRYTDHPDSGKQLVGFAVPHWEEVVELVKELAMVQPGVHYVGWDLALTDKGWVLVEGNDKAQLTSTQLYYGGIKGFLSALECQI